MIIKRVNLLHKLDILLYAYRFDEEVRDYVIWLNLCNYYTRSSCEGNGNRTPHFVFSGSIKKKYYDQIIKVCNKIGAIYTDDYSIQVTFNDLQHLKEFMKELKLLYCIDKNLLF